MTTDLRNKITELASTFASSVLNAIRSASLEEILSETNGGGSPVRRGPGRPRSVPVVEVATPTRRGSRQRGRLERRSADDISQIVERIVALLDSRPEGLRAEQIRDELGLDAKELPRPIAEALSSRRVSKAGQKRATTYFARGMGKGSAKGGKKGAASKKGRTVGRRGRNANTENAVAETEESAS